MRVHICKTYENLSDYAASQILACVRNNPQAVICFASGSTPQLSYQLLAEKAKAERVDFSKMTFIGLDEWVGIAPENEGSCGYFLQKYAIEPLGLSKEQVHLFDGVSGDLKAECDKMNRLISKKGGFDMMIFGLGMNAHLGFNEPGVSLENYAHVVDLEDITISVGQKYFNQSTVLKQGITMGLKYLLEADKVLLLANGSHKAEVVKKMLTGNIDLNVPASIIRKHPHSVVILDEAAAALLTI